MADLHVADVTMFNVTLNSTNERSSNTIHNLVAISGKRIMSGTFQLFC